LAGPLRATSPLYTLLGALLLFGERPSLRQWLGIVVVFASYLAFSKLGQSERIDLWRSRFAGLLFVGTLLGAASSLYDKHLLVGQNAIEPWRLQLWFTVYHTFVLSLVAGIVWWPRRASTTRFEARWSIPAIALLLLVADQFYFRALADHESLVAVVSLLRRASVLVSFLVGGLWFSEQQLGKKALGLLGVAVGVLLLVI
jgi:transporter family protein